MKWFSALIQFISRVFNTHSAEDDDNRTCIISTFPDEITADILNRLPVKSVQVCKLVCSLWRRLCNAPTFAERHLNRNSGYARVMLTNCTVKKRCGVRILTIDERKLEGMSETKKLINGSHYASCNGLLLFNINYSNDYWVISNPVTQEEVDLRIDNNTEIRGFFFDPLEKEYKLLFYERWNRDEMKFSVYVLSSKERRKLVTSPNCDFTPYKQDLALAANGALFLRGTIKESSNGVTITIIAVIKYDFGTVNLQVKLLPEDIRYASKYNADVQVLEINEKLCACHVSLDTVQVWNLTNVESWTWERRCVVHFSEYKCGSFDSLVDFFLYVYNNDDFPSKAKAVPVVMDILNGNLVVQWRRYGVYWYDPRHKQFGRCCIYPGSSSLYGTSYTASFVSLQRCNLLPSSNIH